VARNIINIESVSKAFDIRPLLTNVSLGVSEGERIGIVGRNGGGKPQSVMWWLVVKRLMNGRVILVCAKSLLVYLADITAN